MKYSMLIAASFTAALLTGCNQNDVALEEEEIAAQEDATGDKLSGGKRLALTGNLTEEGAFATYILVDRETGCQYIATRRDSVHLIPRSMPDGSQSCPQPKKAAKKKTGE